MSQHGGVVDRLTAAMETLIERIVRKVVMSAQKIAKVTKAFIDNLGFMAPTATVAEL